jgi:hypothetical protein
LRSSIEKVAESIQAFSSLTDWDNFASVGITITKPDRNCVRNLTKALDESIIALRPVNMALSRGLRWRVNNITSPADRTFLRKFWGVSFFIFILGICAIFYWTSQPISTFEDLNHVSGQIESVSIKRTGGGRQPVEFYLNIILREQPNTIFWSRLYVRELSQKLKPGMITELWVNPDFRVGMERGEIRQISVAGNILLSFGDWLKWKEKDNTIGRYFGLFLILPAFFSGYYAFKPRGAYFKTYSEVQASKNYIFDTSQRLVGTFKNLESISQWQSLSDIRKNKGALGTDKLKEMNEALSDFKAALRKINQALAKISSQLNA